MYKLILILSIAILLLFGFSNCKFDKEEEIPSYVYIDSIALAGTYDSVGSISHNITDAWIFLDSKEYLGAFELPAMIPILASGEHELIIQAGIEENGIAGSRVRYPYYEKYEKTLTLKEGQVDTLHPVVRYMYDELTFMIMEDFEIPMQYFEESETNEAEVQRSSSDVFEKKYALKATLTDDNDAFEIQTINAYDISRSKSVFMELNFKSDVYLTIGYYAITVSDDTQHAYLYLNPTDTWKKIYVNLGSEMSLESTNVVFQFFIGGTKTSEDDTAHVYLDNIKMIHFE